MNVTEDGMSATVEGPRALGDLDLSEIALAAGVSRATFVGEPSESKGDPTLTWTGAATGISTFLGAGTVVGVLQFLFLG